MNYAEAANVLFELRQFRPKPGTASTKDLLAQVDNPQQETDWIQIGGSNGKGSTAQLTASILEAAGYSVGLYTSPHFDDVRERFRVNGRMIPKAAVVEFVELVHEYLTERAASGDPVTFFEATTAMAIWHFAESDVDIGVLEVGIGGQFDATCVVDPIASAVTTVSLEHTEILGDTVEEIARDKAHIAPREAPLVTGTTGTAREAVRDHVQTLHEERETGMPPADQLVTVGDADADVTAVYGGRTNHTEARITVHGADWSVDTPIPLLGAYQAENAGIAVTLARSVADLDTETIERGLRGAHWPGRFEVMGTDPLIVLDGAHNPQACAQLDRVLAEFEYDRLHLVVGAMHEKDHAAMAAALPTADVVTTCRPMRDRAADASALANVFQTAGAGTVRTIRSVEQAVKETVGGADPGDAVVVCGSLFAVAEARQRWIRTTVPKRIHTESDAATALHATDVDDHTARRGRTAGVHRSVKTRVHRRQARWLEEELRALGGMCAPTGFDETVEEPVDVLLFGTRGQFQSLLAEMETGPAGLEVLASDLTAVVNRDRRRHPPDVPWADGPAVMGILNVTPDSFHDGGEYVDTADAVTQAEQLVAEGASIVDVGGESTRPGADAVDPATERDRVVSVIEALNAVDVTVSVDTRKASVARAALEAGADMINDVSGLADPEMRFVAAEYDVPIVIMHSIDTPVVPGHDVTYDDVVEDVIVQLRETVIRAEQAGLDREQIVVDPGLGFGKSAAESFELLGRLHELAGLGCPTLVGHSHKSMFELIDAGPDERLPGTIAASTVATQRGADIIRVHDVAETVAAVRTAQATGSE